MRQLVAPIKDQQMLVEILRELHDGFRYGVRNYTLFQVGKATLLRVSDVVSLKKRDVYEQNGNIKRNAYTVDKKTHKPNTLYLKPVKQDLKDYWKWLEDHPDMMNSEWLFPSSVNPSEHLAQHSFYRVMQTVGKRLQLNYLGTHTMRKTGAYMVYEQSGHNIGLVMNLLNHSDAGVTLRYLGLDQQTKEQYLDRVDFGGLRRW